jgi:hypothetical protein
MQSRSCGGGRALPLLRCLSPEQAQRATGDEVTLQIERIVDRGMDAEEALL